MPNELPVLASAFKMIFGTTLSMTMTMIIAMIALMQHESSEAQGIGKGCLSLLYFHLSLSLG